jgi:hypothetical protein
MLPHAPQLLGSVNRLGTAVEVAVTVTIVVGVVNSVATA